MTLKHVRSPNGPTEMIMKSVVFFISSAATLLGWILLNPFANPPCEAERCGVY